MPELSGSRLLISCTAGNRKAAMWMKRGRALGASVSGKKFAVPFIFSVLLVLSGAFALGWPPKRAFGQMPGPGEASGTMPAPAGIPLGATSTGTMPGPAGIPLGSTELRTPGESPVIYPLGGTLVTGKGPAGASGIPLGSTQIQNPGLSSAPRLASANGCFSVMAAPGPSAAMATSGPAGALPSRLFSAGSTMASPSGSPDTYSSGTSASSSACAGLSLAQQGVVRAPLSQASQATGIAPGASELTSNGLSGYIAAAPPSPGSAVSLGY
jgi:hypothetical protein